jgi:hypothetical protein
MMATPWANNLRDGLALSQNVCYAKQDKILEITQYENILVSSHARVQRMLNSNIVWRAGGSFEDS